MEMDEKALMAKSRQKAMTENIESVPDDISIVQEHTPLYEQFNVEKNSRHDEALAKIWAWAKDKAPEKDRKSILWEVIRLKNRFGSPGVGEKSYAKVLNYITVYRQMTTTKQLLKEMERG